MLNHEELMEQWNSDCILDRSNLLNTMYSHPMLHSKYLTHLLGYKVTLRKYTKKYQTQRMVRQRYFLGEMTKEHLLEHGFLQYLGKKPLKSEMEVLIDSSPEIQDLEEKSLYVQSLIEASESILKEINSRTFLMRSMVDYEKFTSGAS
jgi:hypothetical protein